MQSTKVAPRREKHQSAPAEAGLFPSLPAEIYPIIYQRLSGLEVLRFARICKDTQKHGQYLRQAWADQELDGIILLGGKERWTRFLNLIANCGSAIAPDRWQSFLAEVAEKHSEQEAALMQLAALSPIRGNASHKLISPVRLQAGIQKHGDGKTLQNLINYTSSHKWMAKPACAALTGLWRYQCSGGTYVKPFFLTKSFVEMFGKLQFLDQVKTLPLIQADYLQAERSGWWSGIDSIRDAYARICNAHCKALSEQVFKYECVFWFKDKSKSYLTCLTKLFQDTEFRYTEMKKAELQYIKLMHRESCDFITKSVNSSFKGTAKLEPWREQVPEFTLLVFLALHHSRFVPDVADVLWRRLKDVGFVTEQECEDLFIQVDGEDEDEAFRKVRAWLSLNRDKAPEPEPKRSCIIS